ncbi:hypothetical protein QBC36DRAFT_40021 [Triangularia setosa]|uniref:Secreted protein n=1 Tax=Triangularia setosa TaxID=2587417 RepID=A0AAN6WHH4_9PEZI|nr:hypothetical protein QBC36DRAFT_40021 [Podospora setosa]
MLPPALLLTVIFGLVTTTSAQQMLAIIETNPTYFDSRNCYDGAKSYSIVDFGTQHAPSTGSSCSNKGTVRSTVRGLGSKLDISCTEGKWTNGWKVCNFHGIILVYDRPGRYQACSADDTTIYNCPDVPPACWTNKQRQYKCTGTWYNDP